MRLKYAPAMTAPGGIHVWVVHDSDTQHLGSVDEVCQDGDCFTADDLDGERAVTVEDTEVERDGDGTTRMKLLGVASESSDQ